MSVTKLPFTLIMIISYARANRPPATPDVTERIMTNWFERILRHRVVRFLWLQAPLVPGIVEALTLTAHRFPRTPASKFILRYFAPGSTTLALCITPIFLLSFALVTSGALLRLWCFRTLGKLFTFEASLRRGHRLVTSGPYALVRHPSYTGYLLKVAGLFAWYAGHGSWVREAGVLRTASGCATVGALCATGAATFVGLMMRMPTEDALMRHAFEKEWHEWAERTPYMMIPGIV